MAGLKRVSPDPVIRTWSIAESDKSLLSDPGLPAMVGAWNRAYLPSSAEPNLRFPSRRPLYELVRRVSRWKQETAYHSFGLEVGTGLVFRAATVTPAELVTPESAFHPSRLANTSLAAFISCLEIQAMQYRELFGAPSEDLRDRSGGVVDGERLWAVAEKYMRLTLKADEAAFRTEGGIWRTQYLETWEAVGSPVIGDSPFA